VYGGNSLPTFRDNLLGPSSRVKKSQNIEFPDTARLYRPVVRNAGMELPPYGAERRSETAGFHKVRINLSCFYGGGCGKPQKQLIAGNLTMRYFSLNLKILHRAPFSRERNEIQFTSRKATGQICRHEFSTSHGAARPSDQWLTTFLTATANTCTFAALQSELL